MNHEKIAEELIERFGGKEFIHQATNHAIECCKVVIEEIEKINDYTDDVEGIIYAETNLENWQSIKSYLEEQL